MRGAARDVKGRGGDVDSDAQLEHGRQLAKTGHEAKSYRPTRV